MVNYENSKIYKIVDNTNGSIYIGSTTESTLARRLSLHKAHYNQYIKGNRNFITSFNIIKNGNYDIILLEKCIDIKSKDELHARERYFIENNDCVNKFIPGRSNKEYYETNKEAITIKQKEYYKEWYDLNKTKVIEINKEKHKQYYEQNKDKKKEYYEQNKDKINERCRELKRIKKLELEKNKNI